MWLFPIYLDSGKPFGDGIYWKANDLVTQNNDLENTNDS
jgi:hypothetical protein